MKGRGFPRPFNPTGPISTKRNDAVSLDDAAGKARKMAQAPKRRGRPPKQQQEHTAPVKEPAKEPEFCTVLVMHLTNITLKDYGFTPPKIRKVPFRDRAIIPVREFESITAGDDAAKRPRRLERLA